MTAPEQLPLPLPALRAMGREEFFVSEANRLAVAQIEDWRNWPARKLALTGPEGSGKTHLAHVWAELSGARIVPAPALEESDVPALAEAPVCVEDVEAICGDRAREEVLFHLHNLVLAQGHALLLTSQAPPVAWALSLPDLKSRIMGAAAVRLSEPDDLLLSVLLAKLFADRQTPLAADVIPYLTGHMPRSYAAARQIADLLTAESLAQKKRVTRPMAVQAIDRLAKGADTGPD